jgi:predicted dehydrogenase
MNRHQDDKIRYAVVGLGHISQVAVLPAFKNTPNSELVALVSDDPEKQKQLGKKYSLDRVFSYGQFEECLGSGVDAVYIGLPNHLHRDYTTRALEAGVHVLCEKPMAVTEEECETMIDAAEKNRRKLMIAYRLHFERGNLEAVQSATDGTIGDLRFFSSEFAQQVSEDNVRIREDVAHGGGPVYDMGVYCINASRYLFRDEPTHVFATAANNGEPRFQKVEEMTTAVLRFRGDRLAMFTVSFGAADISRYTVTGTKGVITADPAYEYANGINLQLTVDGKRSTRRFAKRDQFAAELVYFSECILDDHEPEPSGTEGLADVRIIEAIKKRRPNLRQEIHRPAHGKPTVIHSASPSGEAA